MESFQDKNALVTGGASGIGLGIARALADAGANVLIGDIEAEPANKAAEDLSGRGVRGLAQVVDVREQSSVDALYARALDEFGGLDLVFNNAGVYLGGDMDKCTFDDWKFVLGVNLDGMFRVGQAAASLMRQQRAASPDFDGHIVNTASIGGFLSHGSAVAYAVSKFGVVAYSESMRTDLEPLGIGVSTLCPGPIETNLTSSDRFRVADEDAGGVSEQLAPLIQGGMAPNDVGPIVLSGVRRNLAYIFTHDDMREIFKSRFDAVLDDIDRIGEPG